MKKKYDRHCCVCAAPCAAPRGNFNAKKVSLCGKKKCRLQRRSELQRERRKQIIMNVLFESIGKRMPLTDGSPNKPAGRKVRKASAVAAK